MIDFAPLARGIYRARWTLAGLPVLVAVDRHGELRAARPVPPGWTLREAEAALSAWLDKRDPRPLALVGSAPAPRPLSSDEVEQSMTAAQKVIAFGPACRPSRRPTRPRL